MRLVPCPRCTHHVRDRENVCPHCGAPLRGPSRPLAVSAAALLLGLAGCTSTERPPAKSGDVQPEPKSDDTPKADEPSPEPAYGGPAMDEPPPPEPEYGVPVMDEPPPPEPEYGMPVMDDPPPDPRPAYGVVDTPARTPPEN